MGDEQLGLFPNMGGGVSPGAPAESSEPPPPVSPDQLGLFEGVGRYITALSPLLENGRFREAFLAASEIATRERAAESWLPALGWLDREVTLAGSSAESLAQVAEQFDPVDTFSELPVRIAEAARAGLHLVVAAAAEAVSPGAMVRDRPAGWHWLQARRLNDARRSLEATVDGGRAMGPALVLLGNIALYEGANGRSRALYRRAFVLDSEQVPVHEIADASIRGLVDEAEDLGLEPASAWVPVLGYALDLLPWGRERSTHAQVARFQDLLEQLPGSDEVARRRALKALSPELFSLLLENGRLSRAS
jgi:hypothetical protein